MNNAIVTNHAKQRTKDRLGISKKLADKNANKALRDGLTHADTKGNLKSYLDKIYLKHRTANNLRIYNQKVYIFDESVLITVINLPYTLVKTADKLQKGISKSNANQDHQ